MAAVVYVDLVGVGAAPARLKILEIAASIGSIPRTGGEWAIPAPPGQPKIQNLEPFDASLFAGRQEELEEVHQRLSSPDRQVAVVALSGLGGVGKSALARAYCDAHRADYEAIWWVKAESEEDLCSDLAQFARAWSPTAARSGKIDADAREAVAIATGWSGRRPFLFVFDNVTSLAMLRRFRPSGTSRLIVTSRNTSWGVEWRPITVRKLDPDTGAKLLLKASGRTDYEGARRLASELDGLALPLSHAAALLRENAATTFDDLIRRYDTFMQIEAEDADVRTTYATYSVALEDLARKDPISEMVMSAAAYCAPERIPTSVLEGALKSRAGANFLDLGESPADRVVDALGSLARYALIDIDEAAGQNTLISVHRVVQRVIRKAHSEAHQASDWGCATLRALRQNLEANNTEAMRHAREALTLVPPDTCADVRAALVKLFGIPYVPRDQELARMHILLSERGQHSLLIRGARGIGKSSLANMYREQHRRDYAAIWWISADDPMAASHSLIEAARKSGAQIDTADQQEGVRLALEFAANTSKRRPILVIVDNADRASFLRDWLKYKEIKFILCSDTDQSIPADSTIVLGVLTAEQSVDLLRRAVPAITEEEARLLAQRLAFSPQALTQAVYYLQRSGVSVAAYVKELDASPRRGSIGEVITGHIEALPKSARFLLDAMALCASAEIPAALVQSLVSSIRDTTATPEADPIDALLRLKLATKGHDNLGDYFLLHPVVVEGVRRLLTPDGAVRRANFLLHALSVSFPRSRLATHKRLRNALPCTVSPLWTPSRPLTQG